MVHPWTLVILGLAGCGRLGFDARVLADDAAGDGAQPESDLVLRVKFEGDGHDIIGGRDPTCVGAGCPIELTSSPSMAGRALRLTGSECLEYATDPGLRPDALTLSAWFRVDDARTVSLVGKAFDANTTEDNSYELWISDANTIHFSTVNGADPHVFEDGIAPLTWYHVAGTFDGAIKRLYLDGIERMTKVAGATSYDDEPFRIGCDRGNGGVGNFVIGDLDDVRLYRRALTPTEISELASQPP